jgi:hypothetical protein
MQYSYRTTGTGASTEYTGFTNGTGTGIHQRFKIQLAAAQEKKRWFFLK